MQQDQRAVLEAGGIASVVIMTGLAAFPAAMVIWWISDIGWPTNAGDLVLLLASLFLLATGAFAMRYTWNRPFRQRLTFDKVTDTLGIELSYVGKTVRRTVSRSEVAAIDWVVLPDATESGDLEGVRLRLVDGVELFLHASRIQAEAFAAAIRVQLNRVEVTGLPSEPQRSQVERLLNPAPTTR